MIRKRHKIHKIRCPNHHNGLGDRREWSGCDHAKAQIAAELFSFRLQTALDQLADGLRSCKASTVTSYP